MSCKIVALTLVSLMSLFGCTHQQSTSSRIPESNGTPSNGTPGGDHTGSDPSSPHNDVDNNPERTGPSAGPRPPSPTLPETHP